MFKKSLPRLVIDKLKSYNIPIYKKDKSENGDYIIFSEEMIIFIDEVNVSISFQAITKPSDAARYALILREIPDIQILIMEVFIYTTDKKFVCGDEAYQVVRDSIKQNAMKEYATQEVYTQILETTKGFEC